jgi:hypothetical protein
LKINAHARNGIEAGYLQPVLFGKMDFLLLSDPAGNDPLQFLLHPLSMKPMMAVQEDGTVCHILTREIIGQAIQFEPIDPREEEYVEER